MKVLQADSVWMHRCGDPQCRAIHIDLIDENGEVFACAGVRGEDVPLFIDKVKQMAYEIATECDDE